LINLIQTPKAYSSSAIVMKNLGLPYTCNNISSFLVNTVHTGISNKAFPLKMLAQYITWYHTILSLLSLFTLFIVICILLSYTVGCVISIIVAYNIPGKILKLGILIWTCNFLKII